MIKFLLRLNLVYFGLDLSFEMSVRLVTMGEISVCFDGFRRIGRSSSVVGFW